MRKEKEKAIPTIEKNCYIHDQKKYVSFTAPDVDKMQEVIIDEKTKLYIAPDASAEEARKHYFDKMRAKK
ncbi:MAG TPA: hypothetical protein VIH57_25480 [Bacteroidales bacterium]